MLRRPTAEDLIDKLGYTKTQVQAFHLGYDTARREALAEAQRHLRLLIGVDEPTMVEAAMWNGPFPLKGMKE